MGLRKTTAWPQTSVSGCVESRGNIEVSENCHKSQSAESYRPDGDSSPKRSGCENNDHHHHELDYDYLVIALGSIKRPARKPSVNMDALGRQKTTGHPFDWPFRLTWLSTSDKQ
jgi:hypothetical protein